MLFKHPDFEIRFSASSYCQHSVSCKDLQRISCPGFRKLAAYIFGNNETSAKIAMTTLVHKDISERGLSMSFVMPSAIAETTLPKPNDQAITISQTAPEYVAAITFGGFVSNNDILKYAEKLKQSLKAKGIETVGHIRFLGYNPPFQLVNRRNEIIISVNWKDKA